MQIGIEYYQCLGVSLFSILLVSLGYYWTNRANRPLQYIILIIVPLLIYVWFTFTNLEFATIHRLLAITAIFIILFYTGENMELEMFSGISSNFWQGKNRFFRLHWIISRVVLFLTTLIILGILYLLTTWLITLIVTAILLIIFLIITARTTDYISNWFYPLLSRFNLLAIILILGYFSWSHYPVFVNVPVLTIFTLIFIHFIVDRRRHHIYYDYGGVGPLGPIKPHWTHNYIGPPVLPLALALSVAIGLTSWLLMNSAIFSLIWIGFGLICYYFIKQVIFYWEKNYENLHKYFWGRVTDDDVFSSAFDPTNKRSRKKAILYYTRDIRKYLFYILIAIGIVTILPLLLLIYNHITH